MNGRKTYLFVMALLEWFALIAQLILHLQTVPMALTESLIRFFSYFTILTNLLIGIYVTIQLLTPDKRQTGFFLKPTVQTAITLYITVVGLIYNITLRQLWQSEGLQYVIHDILHTIMPLLSIIYWWKWVDTQRLLFKDIPAWLLYPAAYAIYVLIRGHFAAWYPYPFMDVVQFGYPQVLVNSGLLVITFLLFSFLIVFIGKRKQDNFIQKMD